MTRNRFRSLVRGSPVWVHYRRDPPLVMEVHLASGDMEITGKLTAGEMSSLHEQLLRHLGAEAVQ